MREDPEYRGGFCIRLVPYVVTIASVISAFLPHAPDNLIVKNVKLVADVMALNFSRSSFVEDSSTALEDACILIED